VELPQLAEFARLATPLARFGKVGRAASKQTLGFESVRAIPPGIVFQPFNLESNEATGRPPTLRHKIQYQGIFIPCSFPDRSLLGLVSKTQFPLPKRCPVYTYLRVASA
jgi:hypothetical protein